MADLLLELFSEEIPARLQLKAAESLKKIVLEEFLKLKISFESAGSFSTPRRLVLVITGLPDNTSAKTDEKRGPSITASEKAIAGFSRSIGISVDQLYTKSEKKGEFFYAQIKKNSEPISKIISEILSNTITKFPWSSSMRWGYKNLKWIRPLHSIVCLLSTESHYQIIPLNIDGIISDNVCSGHRFLDQQIFSVTSFDDYYRKMKLGKVLLDREQRKGKIWNDATNMAFAKGMEVVEDEGLLEEIVGLVEWPNVLMGEIDQKFLNLPPEVLQVSMREHQKFFSARKIGSDLISSFIVVSNIESTDNGRSIIDGNSKVLNARLSDAKFFWENDLAYINLNGLKSLDKRLLNVTFHNRLGSEYERLHRIIEISINVAKIIGADVKDVKIASSLCKLDLVSEMVYEFPELQGVMGAYYATEAGFSKIVADSCIEHYWPKGPSDKVPKNLVSASVALSDKIDLISSFWAINEKPTGSKDPFALRRAAIGIVRILIEKEINVSLISLLKLGNKGANFEDLLGFINDRARGYLIEKGLRLDILNACFSEEYRVSLTDLYQRAKAIKVFVNIQSGTDLIQAYKRAVNILNAEEKKDGVEYSFDPDEKLFKEEVEKVLYKQLDETDAEVEKYLKENNVQSAMKELASLRQPIDSFFTSVQINSDNPIIRRNRLCLLNKIKLVMHRVAKFSELD